MILDDSFERVVIISLARTPERAARARAELLDKGLSERAVMMAATDGKLFAPSVWWQAGAGAWGCMLSHFRAVHDALHDGMETLLVIEDDCVWQPSAAAMLGEFLPQVPEDWGQIYLGGQHRNSRRPQWLDGRPAVMKAGSVHRTHCYAIHRRAMEKFLQHILHAPDYIEARKNQGEKRHVDHQLEHAQRRGDWPVYCPSFWIAGQGENLSCINGKEQREQWWHIPWREANRRMPLVIVDQRPPVAEEMRWLHFGKNLSDAERWVDVGVRACPSADELLRIMTTVSAEAYGAQRLPGLPDLSGADERVAWVKQKWLGPVLLLSETPDLAALCDFPNSKVVEHPWFHPRTEYVVEVSEPSASTDAAVAARKAPKVHQVWIGPAEMPERLAAYCATMERAFPEWDYQLWGEADMAVLAENAVMPRVVMDATLPIGLRSDVIRLEILRQQGGVYFDTDFEALRADLTPLFARPRAFYYGDEESGRPSNAFMAALEARNPFVEFFLRRIAASFRVPENIWETVDLTGPGRLAESLGLWVVDWKHDEPMEVADERVGSYYAGGTVGAVWKETMYPYHYHEGTWASFDPGKYPQAWAAHHWEGGWHRDDA